MLVISITQVSDANPNYVFFKCMPLLSLKKIVTESKSKKMKISPDEYAKLSKKLTIFKYTDIRFVQGKGGDQQWVHWNDPIHVFKKISNGNLT